MYSWHYNYIKMLVKNASSIGAANPVDNWSAKQHLIPALKMWKADNQGITIVDIRLVYDKWGNSEYTLAFETVSQLESSRTIMRLDSQ